MSFDTIIKGGTVVDGSGLPMRRADVGIKLGLITDIGRLSGARRTIDADGLVVMPGIVDVHTHYDPQLSFEPYATSSCFHVPEKSSIVLRSTETAVQGIPSTSCSSTW